MDVQQKKQRGLPLCGRGASKFLERELGLGLGLKLGEVISPKASDIQQKNNCDGDPWRCGGRGLVQEVSAFVEGISKKKES